MFACGEDWDVASFSFLDAVCLLREEVPVTDDDPFLFRACPFVSFPLFFFDVLP